MAFNGNKSAVFAVEVDNRLTAGNPFALLRGDGEEVANLTVSRFTVEETPSAAKKNGKKGRASSVNENKSQHKSHHEKGEGQINGVKRQDNGLGAEQRNGNTKHEGLINGDASKKPVEDKSSNGDDGWQVIRRRQHEIGSGNNARPIIIRSGNNALPIITSRQHEIGSGNNARSRTSSCPPPVSIQFGDIPSNLFVTPSSSQVKGGTKVKNNGFKRDNANRSDVVKPAAPLNKDQQRPHPPANKSTHTNNYERENRILRRRNSAPNTRTNQLVNDKGDKPQQRSNQVVNDKGKKPEQKVQRSNQVVNDKGDKPEQKDNHVPKRDDAAREAKEAEFNKRKEQQRKEQALMTLKAYEKQLEEKRKAMECLKPQEVSVRVVTLDKDFESMRVIEKKKEESIFIKLNSESDKAKKKVAMDKNGSKALVTNFKPGGTSNYGGGRKGEGRGGDIKSFKSYEELFPAFAVNGSTK